MLSCHDARLCLSTAYLGAMLLVSCNRQAPSHSAQPSATTPTASAVTSAAPSGSAPHKHGEPGFHMDFSDPERFSKHFDDRARDVWQKPKEVTKLLELQPGHVVADVGSGTGYFEEYLSAAVGPKGVVLALDAEKKMVEFLDKRAIANDWLNVRGRFVPYDDPKLEPNSTDRVLVVDTWHHIDDRASYAKKIAKGLKENGFLLIVDYTLESDLGPPAAHRLSPERVMKELAAGGFDSRIVSETMPKQYAVRATPRR